MIAQIYTEISGILFIDWKERTDLSVSAAIKVSMQIVLFTFMEKRSKGTVACRMTLKSMPDIKHSVGLLILYLQVMS